MRTLLVVATLVMSVPVLAAAGGDVRAESVTRAAAMQVPRAAHTATLLGDGRVLVVGGCTRAGCELGGTAGRLAELFDPRLGRFVPAGRLLQWRDDHTATRLREGGVLVAGGWGETGVLATTELYDPRLRAFSKGPPMASPRAGATATPLHDGRVLLAGGFTGNRPTTADAELFDPAENAFRPLPPMTTPRGSHSATVLPDGRVLIAGGVSNGRVLRTTELYDPRTGTFLPGPRMSVPRYGAAGVVVPGGRVLILGGSADRDGPQAHRSTELYDPRTNRFVPGPTMLYARHKIGASVVPVGSSEILVAGSAPVAELLDTKTMTFRAVAGTFGAELRLLTATRTAARRALLVGGYDARIAPTARAWVYR